MYCGQCGKQLAEGSIFCGNCGTAVIPSLTQSQTNSAPPPSVSVAATRITGFATASLICGIAGFFIFPLSILAIVFGKIALSRTDNDPTIKGRGMAVAGLASGIIAITLWVIFGFLIWVMSGM